MFTTVSDVHNRNTRSCSKFSFAFNGVNIWNGIDFVVRNAPNVQSFKTRYKHVSFKK